MLLEHFTNGTEHTVTGGRVGCEIETDFVIAATGAPISQALSQAVCQMQVGTPNGCTKPKIDLGRQKIELALGPCSTFAELLELAQQSLAWLYRVMAQYDAVPLSEPILDWRGQLLDTSTGPRDQLWLEIDGQSALECLCRCSSVQFTIDVNPADAIPIVNALWAARVHRLDYAPNDKLWRAYIQESVAGYRTDRYGGPAGFEDLAGYVQQLNLHDVVMHRGGRVCRRPLEVPDLDAELFLRSIWWHYRLRRHGDTLAVEIRPFARRADDCIETHWRQVASILGL